jgi:predicted TIM-barrel fold metal-dependent hydrolase
MIPLITLEEHFLAEGIGRAGSSEEQFKWVPGLLEKLEDLDALRLHDMDEGQITLQVISHGPGLGTAGIKPVAAANDQLAQAVRMHPTRLAGLAALPTADPSAVEAELRRCVQDLGLRGALIDNHADGVFYDGPAYRPMFGAAQALDVPIYLHPTWPDAQLQPRYEGNYSAGVTKSLGGGGFGWHVDTGLHVLKLFAAGVFDEFPKLKLVVGHMGETLPFMLERIEHLSTRWGPRNRSFRTVYDENIWLTTSGCWSVNPLANILRNTSIDRIMYSVDYPFVSNQDGLRFMHELESSGLVDDEGFRKIGYKNAEVLLGIRVVRDEDK